MQCEMCSQTISDLAMRWCSKRCNDHWRSTVPSKVFSCPGCKLDVLVPAGGFARRKFCSRSCARATYNRTHLRGPRNGRWRGGRAMSYGPEWKVIKQSVRDRDLVCRHCGKSPEQNGRALDVHHLEPFRFSGDNSLENLEALCRGCHMRADDHGRRGSARFLRAAGVMKPITKRELRRFQATLRAVERSRIRRERRRRALELHASGGSLRQISRAVGVSHQTVANWLSGPRAPLLS